MSSAADRRQQILDGIAKAAALAKRDPADVELIAVSKVRGTEEIEVLIAAGQRDFGESRVQEALTKWPELLARRPDIRLHGIGRCQPGRPPELCAFGSYSSAPADDQQLIPAWSAHGLHRQCLFDRHGSWLP